ncbi:TRAP transporter large permease [Treponema sp. OMZ 840]|uniref:TRAP transporter large permease n=1 Tax=Treponema sp. OMZ 840 TaxID=244313 RepID=UPI003D8C473A
MVPIMSITVFVLAVVLMILGSPVFVAIGLSSILTIVFYHPVPLISIPQLMFSGMESYVLVAIPLFILAGVMMETCGVAKHLINFCKAQVSWARGGLGAVNILSSFIFGGISGSSVADTVAIGSIMIPEMEEDGYSKEYSAAITVISSTLSVVVPPSILMIILGGVAELSVSWLLVGGIVPGILMTLSMMIQNNIISRRHSFGHVKKFSFSYLWKTFKCGFWALGAPAIILSGIMTGIVTPTESGAIVFFYTLIISIFYYKTMNWKVLYRSFINGAQITASVVSIIAVSSIFTFILTFEGLPQIAAKALLSISTKPIVILMLINILLLFVGMLIDAGVAIIILAPILFPVVLQVGVDPIHFGVLVVLNLAIGLVTPPFGVCLFSVCNVAKISMENLLKASFPLYASLLVVLILATLFPNIVLFLPKLIFG